jgi:hypothetical protein
METLAILVPGIERYSSSFHPLTLVTHIPTQLRNLSNSETNEEFMGMTHKAYFHIAHFRAYLSVCLSVCLSICRSIESSINPSIQPSISVCLSVCLSVRPSIYFCSHLKHKASAKLFVSLQFLILRQSVGLLGRGINLTQGRFLYTEQHNTTQHRINADIHTLSAIRTHNPSVCLRLRGHCGRPYISSVNLI